MSHNITKPASGEFQVGGTLMINFDGIAFKITGQGADTRKLGRWTWVIITVKHNIKSTFFTCYCPCKGICPRFSVLTTLSVYGRELGGNTQHYYAHANYLAKN